MTTKRKNREYYKRDKNASQIVITKRDRQIIRLVYEHRFLDGDQLRAIFNTSEVGMRRRLGLLFHNGYLDRPLAQKRHREKKSLIYALGKEGAKIIAERDDLNISHLDWTGKNREVKNEYIEHALMVSDFVLVVQQACRMVDDVEFISPAEIVHNRPKEVSGAPLKWSVEILNKYPYFKKKGVLNNIPDSAFGLRHGDETKYFFVEADRSTMPRRRSNLKSSDFYTKLIRFYESHRQTDKEGNRGQVFYENFGFRNPKMITITKTGDRAHNLIETQKNLDQAGNGFKIFLFAPAGLFNLTKPEKVFARTWYNGCGELVTLW